MCNTSNRKCASREPDKVYLIGKLVVVADEAVSFLDALLDVLQISKDQLQTTKL